MINVTLLNLVLNFSFELGLLAFTLCFRITTESSHYVKPNAIPRPCIISRSTAFLMFDAGSHSSLLMAGLYLHLT